MLHVAAREHGTRVNVAPYKSMAPRRLVQKTNCQ